MSYSDSSELDNNSWDNVQDNRDTINNNIARSNDEWDDGYSWNQNQEAVNSYTWSNGSSDYFNDFNWGDNNKKEYFDDFKWNQNNPQEQNDNWDGDIQRIEEVEDNDFRDDFFEPQNDNLLHENIEVQGVEQVPTLQQPVLPQENPILASMGIREIGVRPIHHILNQLMELGADDVEIGAERQGTILEGTITELDDYIVKVKNSFREIAIPIHQIVGIYSRKLPQVVLLPEPNEDRHGDCHCCEGALRAYCSKHIGERYIVNTLARDEVFNSVGGTITGIGDGILIIEDTIAILIWKIISVERDIRS